MSSTFSPQALLVIGKLARRIADRTVVDPGGGQ